MSSPYNLKKVIVPVFFFLISITVYCGEGISVRYLGIENGLSNNVVTAIFRDHTGFMWFGTYDGLNRYDGYGFKVFRKSTGDGNSVNSNIINKIDEDSAHNIWIGGQRDVSIFNPGTGKFSIPLYSFCCGERKHSLNDNVVEIKVLNKSLTLIGSEHNGLFYFDNAGEGKQVGINENGKLITGYYVSCIEFDAVKNITYVFIQERGLYVFDPRTHTLTKKSNGLKTANCLKMDKQGRLWLGENNGLHIYNTDDNTFSKSYVAEGASVTSLIEDREGVLWIATDGEGILLLNKKDKKAVPLASTYPNGAQLINSNSVYTLFEDNQHRKWIGTLRGGVNILEPETGVFTKVVYDAGLKHASPVQNFILSFCEDDPSRIWIGTDGAGLRHWNRITNNFENYTHDKNNPSSISSDFITSILKDAHNNIWLSTWFGGINKFNPKSKTFTRYTCFNTRTNLRNNNIWFLFEDSRKRLWASAVRNGGLYRFNYKTNAFEEFDNNLSEIQSMAEDAEGNLWCGNYSSLIKIDTLHKTHQYFNIGYTVRDIHEDKSRNLWLGTQEGGLLLFNRSNNTIKAFTTQAGLPNNSVLRILEDKRGNLWLSTFNGLSKFNEQTKKVINFSQTDGLQSNQFSFNGALALSNGTFLFGGIKGFNIFSPDSITAGIPQRRLFLTGLKIDNTSVEDDSNYVTERNLEQIKKIKVPYNQASLALDFLTPDYKEASDLTYAYILKGWDKNWNNVGRTRMANYSRLQEGEYVFLVKVSGPDGVWSSEQQLLQITVLPPWYRMWWAYMLYILCGASVVYVYTRYKNRQSKLQYEVRLAQLEMRKEKEINEKKITFFTNVSHEFRTPVSLIINPIKDLLDKTRDSKDANKERGELKVIYRNAQRLLRLVDQLLLFKKADTESDVLHPTAVDFYKLCEDVFQCFTEQAKSRNIQYELVSEEEQMMLYVDREKMEIALFNLLSNAFKYTPEGGKIIFAIEASGTQIKISVSDTGVGIPMSEGNKLFERFYRPKKENNKSGFGIGLYLVKCFVEAHAGAVTYISEENKGTTFFIVLNKAAVSPPHNLPVQINEIDLSSTKNALPHADEKEPVEEQLLRKQKTEEPRLLNELSETEHEETEDVDPGIPTELANEKQSLLVIDDDNELRNYLKNVFSEHYKVYDASSAEEGIKIAHKQLPDLIISDIMMKGESGIELCKVLKGDETVSHIPIILLTGTSSDELQLEGMQSGADDYIKKPFDKNILEARVQSILKRRNVLQSYFYNEITLGKMQYKVSVEYKAFLEKCMHIIETRLDDDQFSIHTLSVEIGMSHSNLYKKIKTISGQTVAEFIRFVRLKKAAELFINTEYNVRETANTVGFYDVKYFRNKFSKLFGVNPSEYIKKYRKPFHNNRALEDKLKK
ncbi:two-component regulator propeller domain-containing protein [Chitinophagaceae bacterium LWZ2-11]